MNVMGLSNPNLFTLSLGADGAQKLSFSSSRCFKYELSLLIGAESKFEILIYLLGYLTIFSLKVLYYLKLNFIS
tara:strand:+ start:69 stop:290 length:222 start_codon:yes stop_codon:yes gene_type:complete